MFEDGATYYIRVRGRVQGPFDFDQLKKLRDRGQFSRAHEVSPDQSSWQSASIMGAVFASPKRAAPAKVEASVEEVAEGTSSREEVPIPPSSPQKAKWHYTVGEEQYGPVTLLELRRLLAGGEVTETDLVWKEGMPDWTAAGDVTEIRGAKNVAQAKNGSPIASSNQAFCFACGSSIDIRAEMCPQCGVRQPNQNGTGKNRTTAGILALCLGGLGAHRFYLGGGPNVVLGIIYLIFCWTLIPAMIAFIEGIYFLCVSDATFAATYNKR